MKRKKKPSPYWELVEATAKEVEEWPAWMAGVPSV